MSDTVLKPQPDNKVVARAANGGWLPGHSGNPGGRPNKAVDVNAMCRKHGPLAVVIIARLMDDDDPRIRFAAAKEILDRGFGKPVQAVTTTTDLETLEFKHLVAAQRWSE